jgi:hypothetical protein
MDRKPEKNDLTLMITISSDRTGGAPAIPILED